MTTSIHLHGRVYYTLKSAEMSRRGGAGVEACAGFNVFICPGFARNIAKNNSGGEDRRGDMLYNDAIEYTR